MARGPSPERKITVALAKVTTGYAPLGVQFQSTGSYDPAATALTYFWNFGEGHSSSSPNPLFVYRTAGNYTATLTITDGNGKSTSIWFAADRNFVPVQFQRLLELPGLAVDLVGHAHP